MAKAKAPEGVGRRGMQGPAMGLASRGATVGNANLNSSKGPTGQGSYDPNNEVAIFMKEAGFQMYTAVMLQNGFDDIETLLAVEDADLRSMGVPSYHAMRLKKSLQDLRRSLGPDESDPNHPIVAFLSSAGLGQYAGAIIRSGFDDMETLLLIEDGDLKELGVPRGHAVKLRKRLREHELSSAAAQDDHIYYQKARIPMGRNPASAQQQRWKPNTRQTTSRPGQGLNLQMPAAAELHQVSNDQVKSAVEKSWEQVQALGSYIVGEILYRHTFEIDPAAMDLFPVEVRQKYREWTVEEGGEEDQDIWSSAALKKLFSKFINAIGCTVAGLNDMSKLVPMLTKLGARHINYGVCEDHWQVLGRALRMTLSEILKEEYTHEVESAWTTVYGFMASIMIQGLRQAKDAAGHNGDCRASLGTASTGFELGEDGHSQDSGSIHNCASTEEAPQELCA